MTQETKKLYILHGYDAAITDHWYPWLERVLKKEGFQTKAMSFPDSSNPKVKDWLNYLDENIPKMDKNSFLVAHSLGCVTALRFLQQIRRPEKIGGFILVAGFYGLIPNIRTIPEFVDLDVKTEKELSNFSCFALDYPYLSTITENRVVVASEDDYVIPFKLNMSRDLAEKLRADFYVIKKGGHFLTEDGFIKFPLIYDLLVKMVEKKE